ncbi:hypothetical protein [Brevundimonas abyssalis]|uniref:hypothetical protein n=1 Tax=Brevundimonas abyssalis TaxID=1125965 RepID=UPI0011D26AF7|nr:hypothetical protein [Brevundimonas abyssalis]
MAQSPEDWLRQALDHQNAGRLEQAVAAFEACWRCGPSWPTSGSIWAGCDAGSGGTRRRWTPMIGRSSWACAGRKRRG